jgi:TatA/E family protein of Tat protein translocase
MLTGNEIITLGMFSDLLAPAHLIVIGLIALLVFGNRLPTVGRGLGKSISEFKKGLREVSEGDEPAARANEPGTTFRTQIDQVQRGEARLPNTGSSQPAKQYTSSGSSNAPTN